MRAAELEVIKAKKLSNLGHLEVFIHIHSTYTQVHICVQHAGMQYILFIGSKRNGPW